MLKLATPMWRASPCRLALASAGMVSASGISGFGQCTIRQIDIIDLERGEAFVHRFGEVVGAQIFVADLGGEEDVAARGTPEARIASPTARSVPYFRAVSMWR